MNEGITFMGGNHTTDIQCNYRNAQKQIYIYWNGKPKTETGLHSWKKGSYLPTNCLYIGGH